jgi:hypothetical protein
MRLNDWMSKYFLYALALPVATGASVGFASATDAFLGQTLEGMLLYAPPVVYACLGGAAGDQDSHGRAFETIEGAVVGGGLAGAATAVGYGIGYVAGMLR